MGTLSDTEIIAAARKYRLDPSAMKCQVFALFDKGYSPAEVRYLLRHLRDPQNPRSFSNTIRKYYFLWRQAQSS